MIIRIIREPLEKAILVVLFAIILKYHTMIIRIIREPLEKAVLLVLFVILLKYHTMIIRSIRYTIKVSYYDYSYYPRAPGEGWPHSNND